MSRLPEIKASGRIASEVSKREADCIMHTTLFLLAVSLI